MMAILICVCASSRMLSLNEDAVAQLGEQMQLPKVGSLGQVRDLFSELLDRGLELIDVRVKALDRLGFLFTRLLVGGELHVAIAFLLRLPVGLLHELHDEILDHLGDRHAHGEGPEDPAVEPSSLVG